MWPTMRDMEMPFSDRVVLIAGATGPAGRACARAFGDAGASLALAGRNTDRLAEVAAAAGLDEARWLPLVGDLRDPEAARQASAATDRSIRTDRRGAPIRRWLVGRHGGNGPRP